MSSTTPSCNCWWRFLFLKENFQHRLVKKRIWVIHIWQTKTNWLTTVNKDLLTPCLIFGVHFIYLWEIYILNFVIMMLKFYDKAYNNIKINQNHFIFLVVCKFFKLYQNPWVKREFTMSMSVMFEQQNKILNRKTLTNVNSFLSYYYLDLI